MTETQTSNETTEAPQAPQAAAPSNDNNETTDVASGTGVPAAPALAGANAVAEAGGAAQPAAGTDPAPTVAVPSDAFDAAMKELDEIERVALFWGGDRGTQVRNSVCRARLLLTNTGA